MRVTRVHVWENVWRARNLIFGLFDFYLPDFLPDSNSNPILI